MKALNIKINQRTAIKVLHAVLLLGLLIAVGFILRELKSLRRDLYAVRKDYYTYYGNYYDQTKAPDAPSFEVLGQEVKKLRIQDMNVAYYEGDYDPKYKQETVREVKVKVKNNYQTVYNFYGNLGAVSEGGIIQRPVTVHPDDNRNDPDYQYGFDLAPQGEMTIYLYFSDTGKPIEKFYNLDAGTEI